MNTSHVDEIRKRSLFRESPEHPQLQKAPRSRGYTIFALPQSHHTTPLGGETPRAIVVKYPVQPGPLRTVSASILETVEAFLPGS
jgi:hypothetical protein